MSHSPKTTTPPNFPPLIPKLNTFFPNFEEQSNNKTHHIGPNNDQPLSGSRWNPTPEQLLALEELYRRGTRTPTATQIQQIATRLRRFGKIEGKNVFYWFQNHKARERQKRRRETTALQPHFKEQQLDHVPIGTSEKKEQGSLRRTSYGVEETKSKGPPCNNKNSEEFASMQGNGTSLEKELQLQNKRKQTLEELSSHPPLYFLSTNTPNFLNFSSKSHQENYQDLTVVEEENREDQTLELFPLQSHNLIRDRSGINFSSQLDTQFHITTINHHTNFTPNQYIEFLPLKN